MLGFNILERILNHNKRSLNLETDFGSFKHPYFLRLQLVEAKGEPKMMKKRLA
jgi:hypothetical protein